MLATERKNRRDREQLVGALADEIAARPQEIIPDLLQTAAGCVYIQDQFERLALGLEKANTWYITEWEWAVRLCSCRPCDFLFDRLCQSWTLFYLGAIRYPDGGRIDLQRAHEALDRHRPQTISIYEFDQQLKWFIALVPDKEKAVAGLKSLVADMIAGLQRRRTMLLAEQTEAQQLDVGAAACDPTLEGRRRSQHEESRFRAFAKMVDLCIKVKKARIAGVFDEPVQIDGFVKRPTPPAAASDVPAGEPEATAASEAPVEKLDAGAMIAEWLDVTGPPLSYPGAAPEPAAPAPLDEPAPGSGGADSGVENQADSNFRNEAESDRPPETDTGANQGVVAADPAESKRIAEADPEELGVGGGEWAEKDHLRTSKPQPPLAPRHSPLTTHHFPEGGQRGEKDEPLPSGPEPEPPCRAQEDARRRMARKPVRRLTTRLGPSWAILGALPEWREASGEW